LFQTEVAIFVVEIVLAEYLGSLVSVFIYVIRLHKYQSHFDFVVGHAFIFMMQQ